MERSEVKDMVLVNALGVPEYKANATDCAGYYFIATTAVSIPTIKEDKSATFANAEEAKAAMIEAGYEIVKEEKGMNGMMRVFGEHVATRNAYNALVAAADAKWANAKPCYVRYGRLPEGGRSKNFADGTIEKGVSVFRGLRIKGGEAKAVPGTNQELGSLMGLAISGRPMYIVTGDEIGVGSDGEPVLANCRILRKVK